jgi:hypothetical protein
MIRQKRVDRTARSIPPFFSCSYFLTQFLLPTPHFFLRSAPTYSFLFHSQKRATNFSLLYTGQSPIKRISVPRSQGIKFTTSVCCLHSVRLQSPIRRQVVPNYHTANFTSTSPTYLPFLLIFTFIFLASLQLDSSLYFLFFLQSALLSFSHFIFVSPSRPPSVSMFILISSVLPYQL